MPVVFTCEHCRRSVTVSSRLAGQETSCPHCRQSILVPAPASASPTPDAPHAAAVPPPRQAPPPLAPPPAPSSFPGQQSRDDVVVVTHTVVWMQGSLLVLLALLGFVSGYFVARSYGPVATHVAQPSFITGTVKYQKADSSLVADRNAVVLLFPVRDAPDRTSKLSVYGLRPQDTSAGPSDSSESALRAIGADICRATTEGFYHLRVRDQGDYFVLYLSAHLQRSSDEPLDRQMLAELGRYVDRANELLGASAFAWKRVTIRGDQEMNQVIR